MTARMSPSVMMNIGASGIVWGGHRCGALLSKIRTLGVAVALSANVEPGAVGVALALVTVAPAKHAVA